MYPEILVHFSDKDIQDISINSNHIEYVEFFYEYKIENVTKQEKELN